MGAQELYEQDENGVILMSFDEYDRVLKTCKQIHRNSVARDFDEIRLVFSSRDKWPTVRDLKLLKVEEKMAEPETFAYLVYYLEVFRTNDPGFKETKSYLNKLFIRKLRLS